jgi:hypothetical protein
VDVDIEPGAGALVPGEIYRDLDGSLVRLLDVERDLCHWVSISTSLEPIRITHRDNFRRRFRPFEKAPEAKVKLSA